MNKNYLKYIKLLPVFILIQVLVLNEILFFAYINPYLYLILIIGWPLKGSKWFLLVYGFILGLSIDIFSGSLGFHSTATVFIAFIRNAIAKITIPHNILGDNDEITLNKIGSKAFITFTSLIISTHYTILFVLDHMTLNLQIIMKITASMVVTVILLVILEILNSSRK